MKRRHTSLCEFAAASVRDRLGVLRSEIPPSGTQLSVEGLHDVRVASRRLRTAARVFGRCWPDASAWQKKLGKLTHALGEARDGDVQIEFLLRFRDAQRPSARAGLPQLLRQIQQQSRQARKAAHRQLARFVKKGVLDEIADNLADASPPPGVGDAFAAFADKSVRRCLKDVKAEQACLKHPQRIAQVHRMRIACKHLRYTLEVLAPRYGKELQPFIDAARKAQTQLGEVHDCDVWAAMLAHFVRGLGRKNPPVGVAALMRDRADDRQKAFGKFVQLWQQLRDEKFWPLLRQRLKSPAAATPRLTVHAKEAAA